ncbi:MAG: VanW family protein [Patescibacteria group bacterium]|nr:VanW family protein [Patescibacteria group bacterium]
MSKKYIKSGEGPKVGPSRKPRRTGNTSTSRGKSPAAVRWAAFFLFLAVVLAVTFYDVLGAPAADMIGKGVSIGPVDASGKTMDEASGDLREFMNGFRLTFVAGSREETIGPFLPEQPDIVDFQPGSAVEDAYRVGRNDSGFMAFGERIGAAVLGAKVHVPYTLDEGALVNALTERFGPMVGHAEDARLKISVSEDNYAVTVVPEKEGMFFDTDALLDDARNRLKSLSQNAVKISIVREDPTLRAEDLEPLVGTAEEIMARAPRTVSAKDLTWEISRNQLADWILPAVDDSKWSLGLDEEKMLKHLETRASSIAVEPQDAVFVEEDGQVTEFEPGINGERLDVATSIAMLKSVFLEGSGGGGEIIELPIMVAEPGITTEKSNPYGIKEIIGSGESNFRGSPSNRRHNIATGAAALHGLLIEPGDEFSLLAALGEIDREHGYLQELVIKENETKPEYGGGLCQIGTTTFRTALNTGLPITMRRNHSYRVPYYERDGDGNYMGPGVDATIYDPAPDFKFLNDTDNYMLFMTDIDGNRLTFTFWGVKDGRAVEQGKVAVWDITPPPEKKEIRTTEIPAGTFKCTESPHSGAKTNFTYTVTYADGDVKEKDFLSIYRPWGEVCLIGVTEEELVAWEAEQAAIEAGEGEEGAEGAETGEGINGIVG